MDFNQIKTIVETYINVSYLVTFMLLGYLITHYFPNLLIKWKLKTVYAILILATIIAIPYLFAGESWQKILFAYAIGTSLHELIFKKMLEDLSKLDPPTIPPTTTTAT